MQTHKPRGQQYFSTGPKGNRKTQVRGASALATYTTNQLRPSFRPVLSHPLQLRLVLEVTKTMLFKNGDGKSRFVEAIYASKVQFLRSSKYVQARVVISVFILYLPSV